MAAVTFDEKKHEYWSGPEKLISVTGVLREAKLFDYKGALMMAADKGTSIHTITELDDAGNLPKEIVNPLVPYLDGWRLFREESKVEVLAIEELVHNPLYRYAGKLDRRIRFNGREGIIDIKSGVQAPWHPIQTMAYAKCFDRPMERYCLYLPGDGSYQLKEHKDPSDWDVFRAALVIVGWKRKMGMLRI
jgi:hypothetical protein